ncbi:MAG: LysR family transcriptional regulator [Rhodocyclaceae bacterium]|nr:LysR family transcriptional regulator [Rhodocyclaceae bacterium]
MDRFEGMRVFCTVVEAGGFAAAADRLGISTSAASRHVAQLEAHLNVRLLNRTTRRVSATEEGYAYFERCTQLLADVEEAEAVVAGGAAVPRGRLRITAPGALATLCLAPALAAFADAHPDLSLDLVLSESVVDFIEEGIDVAIRVGRIGSVNLVARRIGQARLIAAAAPEYLARCGSPQTPDDLSQHQCLTYAHAASGNSWHFSDADGQRVDVRVGGRVHANNGVLLAEMAAAGCGVTMAPDFIVAPLIAAGRLQSVLEAWMPPALPINVVYPTRRHLSAKVRAMSTYLANWFEAERAPLPR